MPCPFTIPKMFWAGPNFLCQSTQKDDLHSVKLFFVPVLEELLNKVKFLGWHKIFWPAQNIFGPVKGQGISGFNPPLYGLPFFRDASS
jgi:hypothetical protein